MDITHLQKLFLLGGYDLEMMTIKQMLEGRKDCVVLDKHLRWDNAKLSAYREDLHLYQGYDVFGIELQEDIPLPHNYHRIDHHNDWVHKPSALEQVASVIDVKLNRDQQLVAANDRGYIPAMHAIEATEEEIADIRKRDRIAQGVTESDEALAERSLDQNLSRYGSLIVVKSLTPRFSPICDKLFPYRRLIVYTDSEWIFYGEGKAELVKQLANDIELKKIYHGGGDYGYIGTPQNAYSKEQIHQFVEQVIKEYGKI